MRKVICLSIVVACLGLLCGCGHNVINYSDGIGFDAGINPENYTLSINLRYGKILTAVTRDNVKIQMTGKAQAVGQTSLERPKNANVGTDGSLTVEIGKQINGYTVDLLKTQPSVSALDILSRYK